MATKRGNPAGRAPYDTTGMDPEMVSTLGSSSTLGKQAAAASPKKKKASAADSDAETMALFNRVDKARAIKGLPALPKPGTKEYRQ